MVEKKYDGIDKDPQAARNPTGNVICEAWLCGPKPETGTCEGWTKRRIDGLYDKVTGEWEKYGGT